jgi:acyl-CoA thioester hydrolase
MKQRRTPRSRVTYLGVVYPWQCDSMGHLTTRYYMGMFDDASMHFLHKIGFRMSMLREAHIGWADVRHTIEYLRELNAGDVIQIESRPIAISAHSVEYVHEMKNCETNQVHARMLAKTVQFDLDKRKAIPVVAAVRKAIRVWLRAR